MKFSLIGIGSVIMAMSWWVFGSTDRSAEADRVPFERAWESAFEKSWEQSFAEHFDDETKAQFRETFREAFDREFVHAFEHAVEGVPEGVTTKESSRQHERDLNGIDRLVVKTFHGDVTIVESDEDDATVRIEEKRVIRGTNRDAVIEFDRVIETRIEEIELEDESEPRALLIEGWKPDGRLPKDLRGASISLRVTAPKSVEVARVSSGAGRIAVEGGSYATLDLSTGHGDVVMSANVQSVKTHSGAGKLTLSNVSSETTAHTGHGDIRLTASRGKASLSSGAGAITTEGGEYDALNLRTGHGDVTAQAPAGSLTVKSGAGRVVVHTATGPVNVDTGHGDIVLTEGSGNAILKAGAGAIRVEGGAFETLNADTGHGDVQFEGSAGELRLHSGSGRLVAKIGTGTNRADLDTGHGDVVVTVDPALPCDLDAATSHGRVNAELSLDELSTNKERTRLTGKRSDGGAPIRLRSGSGNIVIR